MYSIFSALPSISKYLLLTLLLAGTNIGCTEDSLQPALTTPSKKTAQTSSANARPITPPPADPSTTVAGWWKLTGVYPSEAYRQEQGQSWQPWSWPTYDERYSNAYVSFNNGNGKVTFNNSTNLIANAPCQVNMIDYLSASLTPEPSISSYYFKSNTTMSLLRNEPGQGCTTYVQYFSSIIVQFSRNRNSMQWYVGERNGEVYLWLNWERVSEAAP